MSRLPGCFEKLAAANRRALITFITAGDPDQSATVAALHALVRGGADILELGIPFSDPEAEGPTIQRSSERGLASGTRLVDCLEMVRQFRLENADTPVVLMGYLNSVLAMGEARFAAAAAEAGVDGLIMVNLPPEEADTLQTELRAHNLNLIFLIAPTTTAERAKLIMSCGSGFLYYVSLKGITGADNLDVAAVGQRVETLRAQTSLPLVVGFGIKDAAAARDLAAHADGVVVGSALVNIMDQASGPGQREGALIDKVSELRVAIDNPAST